jgi:hypothetical protein
VKRFKRVWLLAAIEITCVVAFVLGAIAWNTNWDRSVEFSDKFGKVQNDSAFDRAGLDLGEHRKVVLPINIEIRREGEGNRLQIFMRKTMEYAGHPTKPMSIKNARKNMGCAVMVERNALGLATFGEWDSRIEGGADMHVVVLVPKGTKVEQRRGLSGPKSAGKEWGGRYLVGRELKDGYFWYGPSLPADGWSAIPDTPDPEKTAGYSRIRIEEDDPWPPRK